MKYERLTDKKWKKIEKHCYAKGLYFSNQFTEEETDKMIKRLAELEDKIESGKMIDCPYGDKVWVIDYDEDIVSYVCVGSNKDFLFLSPTVYAGKDITTAKELCNYYVDCYIEDGDDADIVVFPRNKCFTDKSQAEARLKELRNK